MGQPEKYVSIVNVKDFVFGRVPLKEAQTFITRYEWLGYPGRAFRAFGIWRDGGLYGVELFGQMPTFVGRLFPYDVRLKTLSLGRGACCLDAGPHAGSMLIGACLRELRRQGFWLVVAYADPQAGERGVIYRAAGAVFAGASNQKGIHYLQIDGKWYSPSSVHRRFGGPVPPALVEDRRTDRTAKTRWIWILNPAILPYLPSAWR